VVPLYFNSRRDMVMHKIVEMKVAPDHVQATMSVLADYGFNPRMRADQCISVDVDTDYWAEDQLADLFDWLVDVLRADV